jgi:hypothetical protein
MPRTDYWTTDSEFDAAYSLVAATEMLPLAESQPHYWKWFILAVHSALQGLLTLALRNTDTVMVQKPGVSRKMLAAFAGEGDFPDPHMDNFLRLYRKAQIANNLPQGSLPLPESEEHDRAMSALDELRDGLTHFNSKTFSIERAMLVECPLECCAVARHLLASSGAIHWRYEEHRNAAVDALGRLESQLRERANNSFKGCRFVAPLNSDIRADPSAL